MDAEKILRTLLEKVAVEQNYNGDVKITPLNTDGANYTSAAFLATLSAPQRDDLKLFAKVATIAENLRHIMNADSLFTAETFVYTELANILKVLEQKHNITGENALLFPKYYGCNSERLKETIVLEDLVAAGYENYDRLKPIDWEYASQAVTELAKWHALSIAFQHEKPEEFEVVLKEKVFKMPQTHSIQKMVDKAKPALDEKHRNMLDKYMENYSDRRSSITKPKTKTVLAHGDFRPNNLMTKRREDGTLEFILIDFQTVHEGRPTTDLVFFIFTGSDKAFRQRHYRQLVDFYYQQLGAALGRMQLDINQIYPKGSFEEELQESLSTAVGIGVIILPNVMKPEGVELPLEQNKMYAQRFSDVLDDLTELGVRLV